MFDRQDQREFQKEVSYYRRGSWTEQLPTRPLNASPEQIENAIQSLEKRFGHKLQRLGERTNMSNVMQSNPIESALIQGDLSRLTSEQRLSYYKEVCSSLGLNPLTKPFDYIQLNGKLTLYAKRDATDQLRKVHKVSIAITDRQKIDDVYIVTAKARDKDGREDESTGAVNVAGLKGEALANAFLKAETKAKRRVTLSICGLGLLDETEVETIPDARPLETAVPSIPSTQEVDEIDLGEEEESSLGDYICTVGRKHKGKRLADIGQFELNNYLQWLKGEMEKKGEAPGPMYGAFIEHAEAYLKSLEFERK